MSGPHASFFVDAQSPEVPFFFLFPTFFLCHIIHCKKIINRLATRKKQGHFHQKEIDNHNNCRVCGSGTRSFLFSFVDAFKIAGPHL